MLPVEAMDGLARPAGTALAEERECRLLCWKMASAVTTAGTAVEGDALRADVPVEAMPVDAAVETEAEAVAVECRLLAEAVEGGDKGAAAAVGEEFM